MKMLISIVWIFYEFLVIPGQVNAQGRGGYDQFGEYVEEAPIDDKGNKERELNRLLQKLNNYQEKLKSGKYDVNYFVIDKGRDRKYIFKLVDTQVIDTIFGKTETILIKKIIEGNKRNTLTWYAINHAFIPVKIEQYRKKTLKFTAYLTSYTD